MLALRRGLLGFLGLQVAVVAVLSLIDSHRRRSRGPHEFPITRPVEVEVSSSRVTTYTFGQDVFDDMLAAIAGARRRIFFETYIWKGDETGERFKQALTDAAHRGVEVFVAYDGFANLVVASEFKRFDPMLHVLEYPVYSAGWRFFDLRRYGLDHRKILVVDEQVGFVGGFNIGDEYATRWRDTHLRVRGEAAWDLALGFADFWNANHRRHRRSTPRLSLASPTDWEPRIRVQRNMPRLWVFPIRGMYLEAINRASQRIWMTHAYFIPDADLAAAITGAARRGVDVRLLLPADSNHVVADWLARGYYGEMLAAGVRIFRFQAAMVHAKTCTIDGRWSTVGTANIDQLSMTGNYEVNLEIIDEGLAAQLENIYETDLTNCVELTEQEWSARGIYKRFTEAVLAPLRPLL